jgi:excisionase family DNA binding protein
MTDRLDAALLELAAAIREEVSAASSAPPAPDRLLDIEEAGATLGIGRTATYGELAAGRLRSVRVGRRRLIPAGAIAAFIVARQAER